MHQGYRRLPKSSLDMMKESCAFKFFFIASIVLSLLFGILYLLLTNMEYDRSG